MFHVYLPQSQGNPDQRYIGLTTGMKRRFTEHNAGKSAHTSKFLPWRLVTYVAFSDQVKATAFERYLKSGSGPWVARRIVGGRNAGRRPGACKEWLRDAHVADPLFM